MISLLRYAKKYRVQVILGPVFKFLEAFFELLLPLIMARLVDEGIVKGNSSKVLEMAGWMLVLSIVGMLCAFVCQYFASVASQGFGTVLRNKLLAKIQSFSHHELNIFGTDTLITRMTSDINQVQWALAMFIRLVIRAPFLSIGSVIMAFYIDPKIGFLFLLILPIFCLILFFIIRFSVPLYKTVQQKLDGLNLLVSQNLTGIRVIRAFARTPKERQSFNQQTDDLAKVNRRVANISSLLSPATTLIMNIGVASLLYLGGVNINIGHLQQGQILALINYMNQMLLALIIVSDLVVLFTRAAASASRINQVFETEINLEDAGEVTETLEEVPLVQFENVDFRYREDWALVLKNISFTLKSGETLGITGGTGSGKSSLIELIPRFYDVSAGNLFFAGTNVKAWSLTHLRQEIALVPQTAVLFSGTIRENLRWGKADATDEECWQALDTAQATEFVRQLPQQLDTMILENGKNFSGGQRQRLTIARGIIARPKLLILDDSLSALDYQTDLDLRKALKKDLTSAVIIISQRLRSLQEAQNILLLEKGQLIASGTHQDLLASSAEYRKLAESQEEV